MKLIASPSHSLHGEVVVPGDKSITHRAILMAAMARGESRIEHPLISGVTMTMLEAVRQVGVAWELDAGGDVLTIHSPGLKALTAPDRPLDCKNSATTMRLLAGCLSASGIPAVLDGSEGLRKRPMKRIVEPLQKMGVPVEAGDEGKAPLKLSGRPAGQSLSGLCYVSPVASAQVKSCVLLAGLAAGGAVIYTEPSLSRDHTELMLKSLGVGIETVPGHEGHTVILQPGGMEHLRPLNIKIPGDFSAASFLIVAALITPGSSITLKGVGLNPTRTGLMTALQEMGADIRVLETWLESGEAVGNLKVSSSVLKGGDIGGQRVVDMIDEFPVFAVAAANAAGVTRVSEAEELRLKESDRIAVLCAELCRQGVAMEEKKDGFVVAGKGSVPGGAASEPHRDHRLAMSLAVLGLNAKGSVTVHRAEILAESYPQFPDVLKALGAEVRILPDDEERTR